ncbi:MAG: nucleotidyltransferase domain-containing protein [Acidobacteria bacterium]|nr:nucleotidyltransferase domain-containing protein [Acidobacteriota bacterium]
MASSIPGALAAFFERERIRGLTSVYLFGSHATGRPHRESDVDVAVLLDHAEFPTRASRFEVRLSLSSDIGRELGSDAIDLIVLNDAPPHLGRRVMTEGARVFCADPEADHAARRTALLRAADLEPFLRRTRRVKLHAIAR